MSCDKLIGLNRTSKSQLILSDTKNVGLLMHVSFKEHVCLSHPKKFLKLSQQCIFIFFNYKNLKPGDYNLTVTIQNEALV